MTPFIHYIVLRCIKDLNGERTISSIYHLLRGKKSSQTIQDARLFKLDHLFRTYPQISRNLLMLIVDELNSEGFIALKDEQTFVITEKGKVELNRKQFPFLDYLNGWTYLDGEHFWKRLSLTVQIASNLKEGNRKFLPIQQDKETQLWFKRFIRQNRLSRKELGEKLFCELTALLKKNRYIDPSIFVIRLSGHRQIGLTAKQASDFLNLEYTYYNYQFLSLLHFMMDCAKSAIGLYPIVYQMTAGLTKEQILTKSTGKTYELLQNGYSIEEISEIRKLKISTIQDHIVEIALHLNHFDIYRYVSKQLEEKIIEAMQKTKSKQLRTIRTEVDEANYFQIRLVIAKHGDVE